MPRGSVTRLIFLVAIACLIFAPLSQGQQTGAAPESVPELPVGLAPGDTMDAVFLDFPEAPLLHLTVTSSGTIFVPYAGQVKVQGLMPEQAEKAIEEALQAKQVVKSAQVSLNIISARNLSVMVLGAATLPHPVPLFSPAPLSFVLSQVGPFTLSASYHILVAHRDGSPPADVELDHTGMTIQGLNATVSPGDIVTIATAGSFFALGEFNHPGIFSIVGTQHMTLMQAVAVAGGPDLYAGLSKARILRNVDGHREEIFVDLAKLHDGKIADPLIQTDDIVFIPRSNGKVVLNSWLSQSLYALTTVSVVKNY
jgi:polysaccharide export outer membrane protein